MLAGGAFLENWKLQGILKAFERTHFEAGIRNEGKQKGVESVDVCVCMRIIVNAS